MTPQRAQWNSCGASEPRRRAGLTMRCVPVSAAEDMSTPCERWKDPRTPAALTKRERERTRGPPLHDPGPIRIAKIRLRNKCYSVTVPDAAPGHSDDVRAGDRVGALAIVAEAVTHHRERELHVERTAAAIRAGDLGDLAGVPEGDPVDARAPKATRTAGLADGAADLPGADPGLHQDGRQDLRLAGDAADQLLAPLAVTLDVDRRNAVRADAKVVDRGRGGRHGEVVKHQDARTTQVLGDPALDLLDPALAENRAVRLEVVHARA